MTSGKVPFTNYLIDPVKHSQENSSHAFGIKVASATYTTKHIVVENKIDIMKTGSRTM